MAYYSKKNQGFNKSKRNNRAKTLKNFAYNLAQVQKGLSNKDSQVYESYKRGEANPAIKEKKPLI